MLAEAETEYASGDVVTLKALKQGLENA